MKNMCQIYNVMYDKLVDAGVAINLDVPVFTDWHENEVTEDEYFGLVQEIKITHPRYIIFVDGTGCSTS